MPTCDSRSNEKPLGVSAGGLVSSLARLGAGVPSVYAPYMLTRTMAAGCAEVGVLIILRHFRDHDFHRDQQAGAEAVFYSARRVTVHGFGMPAQFSGLGCARVVSIRALATRPNPMCEGRLSIQRCPSTNGCASFGCDAFRRFTEYRR